jgi:hypothetical protein
MKQIISLISIVALFVLASCDNTSQQTTKVISDYSNQGIVKQVLQTSSYTYCLVKEGNVENWIAVNKINVSEGQTLYFNQGTEMFDFHSKELDHDFASVFFVQDVSLTPKAVNTNIVNPMQGTTPQKPDITKQEVKVESVEGGITIAELFANKAKYSGKSVKVSGKVTKVNLEIMNTNWFHLQDGTDFEGNFDLTVTSSEIVNQGATVTFEGVITTDKDFGAGYFYPIIMENAKIIK